MIEFDYDDWPQEREESCEWLAQGVLCKTGLHCTSKATRAVWDALEAVDGRVKNLKTVVDVVCELMEIEMAPRN